MADYAHITLQGKGGIGKTFISFLLAQALGKIERNVQCIDIDPTNKSFSRFPALKVETVDIYRGAKQFTPDNLDALFGRIGDSSETDFVIDSGASSFEQFAQYLKDSDPLSFLESMGKVPVVNIVISGGNELEFTLAQMVALLNEFGDTAKCVVWLNEKEGAIISDDGRPFTEMKPYLNNKKRINGIITIPEPNSSNVHDLRKLISNGLLFHEVNGSDLFNSIAKHRLFHYWRGIFAKIELALESLFKEETKTSARANA